MTKKASPTAEVKYETVKAKNKKLSQKNKALLQDLSRVKKRLAQTTKEKNLLLDQLMSKYDYNQNWNHIEQDERLVDAVGDDKQALKRGNTFDGIFHSSRPKRLRKEPVESKLRKVQPLEKISNGEYKLPVRVGIITVHSLGKIVPIPTYHSDRYIWPPGFKISRTYLSMINPNTNTIYTCSVEENGEQGPKFRALAEDCPDNPIIANSATGVWTVIVKSANKIRNREHSNSASGPDYYGFTHATIAKMIQDLPYADQCENYVWQRFDLMHERTAAGVAAATEKKIVNLEIMGSANKKPSQAGFSIFNNNKAASPYSKTSSSSLQKIMNPPDELAQLYQVANSHSLRQTWSPSATKILPYNSGNPYYL